MNNNTNQTFTHSIIKFHITGQNQMSDSMILAILLAISGGLMDAYTYLFRGGVFANAQTGNIILFSISFCDGNLAHSLKYALPILAFCFGIALAEIIRFVFSHNQSIHWRQFSVLVEALVLFSVGLISTSHDTLANALVSFACGIQVESFRKVNGYTAATTMCIGNLRSGVQSICDLIIHHNISALKKGFTYFGIILSFAIGAVLGKVSLEILQQRAIWCSSVCMSVACFLMFIKESSKDATVL